MDGLSLHQGGGRFKLSLVWWTVLAFIRVVDGLSFHNDGGRFSCLLFAIPPPPPDTTVPERSG